MWGAAPRLRWFVFCTVACLALLAPGLGAARVDAAAADATFADVPESNPFFAEVEQLFARGITNGCGVNSSGQRVFCPLQNVTRQEMAVFVNRGKALALLRPTTATFADVPTSHMFFGHIERFVADGITNGCGVNSTGRRIYCPLQNVTRQEMAVFLMRARGLAPLTPATPTFADVPTSHPFYGQIERFSAEGITSGCGVNRAGQRIFCPLQQVTRQEVAAFLIRTFPTAIPDTSAPTAPTGLVLSARTQTTVTVGWAPSLDNFAVTGYGAYVNGNLAGSPGATSFTFTGLTCGTLYPFSIDAVDLAGNRSSRTLVHVSTNACQVDTQSPSVPQGLHTASKTQTTVTLAWNAATDNQGVAGYHLYRDNVRVASTANLTYTYTGLTCGTLYALALEAYDAAGNVSYRPEAVAMVSTNACSADTQAPTPPSNVAVTGTTSSSVSVSWSPSSDNVAVSGYGRYVESSLVASADGTTHTFTGLACNTTHSLGVDAYDAAGNRSTRSVVSAATAACPSVPGGSVANLWLDTNGGSCARQATPGAYSDAQACGSVQAAANAAASGDTINIVDGTYAGQSVSGTKTLTFRAAGPGRPSFGQFVSAASNLTVMGVLIQNRNEQPVPFCSTWILDYTLFVCAPNNTYDNVIVDGMRQPSPDPDRRGGIQLTGSGRGFVFRNGEVRGIWDSKGFQGGADDMLLENNTWHDIRLTNAGGDAGVHNECVYIGTGNRQIWRGNKFLFCPIMAMFFANYAGGPPFSHVLIENNVFTHATNNEFGNWHDGSSFVIPNGTSGQNQVNNWVIRYNTFEVAPLIERTPGTGDDNGSALFYGNLGAVGSCSAPEWTYSYNVGSTCGRIGEISIPNATNNRTNQNQAPFYVNAPAGDFHLKPGVAAIDRGDPARYPSVDADKFARPVGSAPDAGAYEYRP